MGNRSPETAENNPPRKALNSSLSFLRRFGRDVMILSLLLFGINAVQTLYFNGKKISPGAFTTPWPSLSGAARPIVASGRLTLVYLFAPWCGVCKFSSSNLNSLKEHFDVTSVALSYNDLQEVQEFIKKQQVHGPVVLGSGQLESQLDVGQFPTYFIVGPKGNILGAWSGYTTTLGLWARMLGALLIP
jgi:thiol-disulfide isomerase/thioredoxin